LSDLGYTLARRRAHRPVRTAVMASSLDELTEGLREVADGETPYQAAVGRDDRGPVWVFSGQGSQWARMGAELLATEPVFAATVAEAEPMIARESGFSVTEAISALETVTGIERIQPAIFTMQVALAATMKSYGVQPGAVVSVTASAGGVLVWANVGGLIGALALSALTQRFAVRRLVVAAMLLSAVMVTVFGQGQPDLARLSLVAALAGICTNAVIVGLYAMVAQSFPTAVRAGGTGFIIGVGRGGAALGPIVAGFLFSRGAGLPTVAMVMACGSLLAAAALLALRYQEQHNAA